MEEIRYILHKNPVSQSDTIYSSFLVTVLIPCLYNLYRYGNTFDFQDLFYIPPWW